jgi:hypothetical protein
VIQGRVGARYTGASRFSFLACLYQLPRSLEIAVAPQSHFHSADFLQRWRLNPIAIGDVPLKSHQTDSQLPGSFATRARFHLLYTYNKSSCDVKPFVVKGKRRSRAGALVNCETSTKA